MLGRLFSREETTETRFDQTKEFKHLKHILKKIRQKEQALAQDAEYAGYGSLDQRKHHIIKSFIDNADLVIDAFNQNEIPDTTQALRSQQKSLVQELQRHLNQTRNSHYSLLNRQRGKLKASAATSTRIGVFGGAITAGIVSPPLFFGSGLLTFLGANAAGQSLASATGLYEEKTDSILLLNTLRILLIKMNESFDLELSGRSQNHIQQSGAQLETEEPFAILSIYSPITESYIESMREMAQTFKQQITALDLTDDERNLFSELQDDILFDVPDIPVRLNGKMYDLNTLLDTPTRNGHHIDPFKNTEFFMRDIQPAFDVAEAIQKHINDLQEKRQANPAPLQCITNEREKQEQANAPNIR